MLRGRIRKIRNACDLLNVIWDNWFLVNLSKKYCFDVASFKIIIGYYTFVLYCIFWKYNLKYRSWKQSINSCTLSFADGMLCAYFSRPYKRPVEPLKAAEVNGWMDLSDEYPPYRGASSSITVRMCPIRRVFLFSPLPMGQMFARFEMDDRRWDSRLRFGTSIPSFSSLSFLFFFLLSMINTI